MKKLRTLLFLSSAILLSPSCGGEGGDVPDNPETSYGQQDVFTPRSVAMMMASLPIGPGQLREVHNAVNSSSVNGYDEEYMMCDLIGSPGAGVGDSEQTKAATRAEYSEPLKDLIAGYLALNPPAVTRAGADVEYYLNALSVSGMQIYWPYSEDWDGEQMPLVTFDPGFGAKSNYAYEIGYDSGGYKVLDSVYVDENVAASRPVWVINSNDDSGFTPLKLFLNRSEAPAVRSSDGFDDSWTDDGSSRRYNLFMKDFTMHRNFDTWFAGGSEFFIQCGSVYSKYTTAEAAAGNFTPEVTDLMVVVKRRQLGERIPFNAMLLSGFTEDLNQIAFLITESDGGTRTSWKCKAELKIKSKTYGVDVELPFNSNDDIVWRGKLDMTYLRESTPVQGRFGDVDITFSVE